MKKIIIDKEELQKVYENLKNQEKVAEHFGVSVFVIRKNVREYGLPTYEHATFIPPRDVLYNIFANGGNKRMVCDMFGVCTSQVSKWLKHYGISSVKSDYKHLNNEQYAVVIGSILGDGHLEGRVLSLNHSIKQEDYLNYKASFFKDNISPLYYRTTKEGYKSVRCRTKAYGDLKKLRDIFYVGRRKIIPNNIQEMLSPLAIAIWYMDDGTRKGKSYGNIATCCFTKEECQILSDALNSMIGIGTYVVEDSGYFNIKIPARDKSFQKFCDYIREFVPVSMKYKLSEEV